MSTKILIIRHGETAWNRGKIFRGTYDIPLNENGKQQARLAAEALKDMKTVPICVSKEKKEVTSPNLGQEHFGPNAWR